MTKLTVNRLAHALDDLASHMDVDQFALASMSETTRRREAFLERRKTRFSGDSSNGFELRQRKANQIADTESQCSSDIRRLIFAPAWRCAWLRILRNDGIARGAGVSKGADDCRRKRNPDFRSGSDICGAHAVGTDDRSRHCSAASARMPPTSRPPSAIACAPMPRCWSACRGCTPRSAGRSTAPSFRRYIDVLDLSRRYPGFQALQSLRKVQPEGLDAFVAEDARRQQRRCERTARVRGAPDGQARLL
jgi:hypothetical protein